MKSTNLFPSCYPISLKETLSSTLLYIACANFSIAKGPLGRNLYLKYRHMY